jgi:hypothetical protein
MALLDVLPAAAQAVTGQQEAAKAPAPQGAAPAAPQQDAPPAAKQDAAALFASLRAAAMKLATDSKTEKVGKPLIAMLDGADNDIAKLKKSLGDWYNSGMDRVSGWYKYRTQKILFGIGLVLAISLNANTVSIVRQLSKDSTLRQSIVAAATSAKQPDNSAGQPIADQIKQAKDQVLTIDKLGIPLGWNSKDFKEGPWPWNWAWNWEWPQMCVGWLLTAIAISLGAPFWFDMLNKIMVVRSTVKPAEKSQPEGSKDKK